MRGQNIQLFPTVYVDTNVFAELLFKRMKQKEVVMKKVTYEMLKSKGACPEGLKWFVEWWGEKAELQWSVCFSAYNSNKTEWGEWLEKNIKPLLEEPKLTIADLPLELVKNSDGSWTIVLLKGTVRKRNLVSIDNDGMIYLHDGIGDAKPYGLQLDDEGRIIVRKLS